MAIRLLIGLVTGFFSAIMTTLIFVLSAAALHFDSHPSLALLQPIIFFGAWISTHLFVTSADLDLDEVKARAFLTGTILWTLMIWGLYCFWILLFESHPVKGLVGLLIVLAMAVICLAMAGGCYYAYSRFK